MIQEVVREAELKLKYNGKYFCDVVTNFFAGDRTLQVFEKVSIGEVFPRKYLLYTRATARPSTYETFDAEIAVVGSGDHFELPDDFVLLPTLIPGTQAFVRTINHRVVP